jgi:hypothetical protein
MQITIALPQDLEQDLIRQAAQSNVPLQTLIIQALRQLTQATPSTVSQWSDAFLSYQGMPDFPAFESYRKELPPLRERNYSDTVLLLTMEK